jgi:hypothetical protein
MTIVKTELVVTQNDSVYTVDGDWTAEQLVASYSAAIPGLASMTSSSKVETRSIGQVRVVTFSARSGNKGA